MSVHSHSNRYHALQQFPGGLRLRLLRVVWCHPQTHTAVHHDWVDPERTYLSHLVQHSAIQATTTVRTTTRPQQACAH